jgi:hypothetical protein
MQLAQHSGLRLSMGALARDITACWFLQLCLLQLVVNQFLTHVGIYTYDAACCHHILQSLHVLVVHCIDNATAMFIACMNVAIYIHE